MAKRAKAAARKSTGPAREKSGTRRAGAARAKASVKSGKKRAATAAKMPKTAASTPEGRTASDRRPPSTSAHTKLSIRMYRGLLGDFFLIKHTDGTRTFKMLVDCGVLQCIGSKATKPATSLGKERIVAGAIDLMRDTGGQIDLMVATHEHYDHLSGFILANEVLKPLKIGKVWMAWTEDRADKLANRYRDGRNKALSALAALAQSPAFGATAEMMTVTNLLQFYGGAENLEGGQMSAAKRRSASELPGNASCGAVLEWLKQKAGVGNVSFAKPGQMLRWGLDDAFRAYVLGPPRDDEKLRKLDPSKGAEREVYLALSEDVETMTGLSAIHRTQASQERLEDQPFAPLHWRVYDAQNGRKSKSRRAQTIKDPIVDLYQESGAKHRRIDCDWLGSAENLALKIDNDVNNTSLALALELTDKKILLFPGDAQVGNWLSWGSQTYPADESKDGLTIDELLARTIFYKVGHHASHNATLRERGLELMTDTRLCAMIPVDEKAAHEQKTKSSPKGWAMPYGDLYTRLEQRTNGRTLRGDGDVAEETRKFKNAIFNLSYGENFKLNDPLWVELGLELQK